MKLALYFLRVHNSFNATKNKGKKMNIARNMEAIFLVALALTAVTAYAAAPEQTPVSAPRAVATSSEMTVITITGKRLTPAQKAGLVD